MSRRPPRPRGDTLLRRTARRVAEWSLRGFGTGRKTLERPRFAVFIEPAWDPTLRRWDAVGRVVALKYTGMVDDDTNLASAIVPGPRGTMTIHSRVTGDGRVDVLDPRPAGLVGLAPTRAEADRIEVRERLAISEDYRRENERIRETDRRQWEEGRRQREQQWRELQEELRRNLEALRATGRRLRQHGQARFGDARDPSPRATGPPDRSRRAGEECTHLSRVAPEVLRACETLRLEWHCNPEQVRLARKDAARSAHPDRHGPGSTRRMASLNHAVDVLVAAVPHPRNA